MISAAIYHESVPFSDEYGPIFPLSIYAPNTMEIGQVVLVWALFFVNWRVILVGKWPTRNVYLGIPMLVRRHLYDIFIPTRSSGSGGDKDGGDMVDFSEDWNDEAMCIMGICANVAASDTNNAINFTTMSKMANQNILFHTNTFWKAARKYDILKLSNCKCT